MSEPNYSAIRARLKFANREEFIAGYSRFISSGGMFIPLQPAKLKPVGTTIRFQFLLGDGSVHFISELIDFTLYQELSTRNSRTHLHSRTKLSYRLTRAFDRFAALAGIDDRYRSEGDVTLTISGDGKQLLSEHLTGSRQVQIDLDLRGVRRLEILVDYGRLPESRPESWPEIRSNERGLSRFVYGFMVDTVRRVSIHVTIGSAARKGRDMGSYFVLCRAE